MRDLESFTPVGSGHELVRSAAVVARPKRDPLLPTKTIYSGDVNCEKEESAPRAVLRDENLEHSPLGGIDAPHGSRLTPPPVPSVRADRVQHRA